MRIALIVEWLDPWRGGAETSTRQFLRHLVELGVEVDVFTRSRSASAPGMTLHTVQSASPSKMRSSALFPSRAARAVRQVPCDLVHSIVPCTATDVYQPRGGTVAETIERNIALRPSAAGKNLKRLVNRFNAKQRSRLRLERRLLSRSPRPIVVAISDYVQRQLTEHYAFPPSHIRKVFNGVDPDTASAARRAADRADVRQSHNIGANDTLAVLVAHNFKLKGVRRWIEALARVRHEGGPPLRSLIVGRESPLRWQKLATRMGLAEVLRFVGPTRRINAHYHAADFLVHPTYYDPCSRVVLEALTAGVPCITTRFDGASEVIENDVNGYVLDTPDDVAALAQRTVALCDPATRHRLAAGTADGAAGITMRRHAEEMVRVYETILANGARS